jgi:hypothetical protein
MTLLRDEADFGDVVGEAARNLGDLDPTFIEKDYWVTQILRVLAEHHAAGIVFKGGTSLSKGYRIIERFSEDVDILVTPIADASRKGTEAHLLDMSTLVSNALGLEFEEARKPGGGWAASRGDYLRYAPVVEPGVDVAIHSGAVLLETGYAGQPEPAEIVTIAPLVVQAFRDGAVPANEDLAPFTIRALQPRCTLIEKMFALHHVATSFLDGNVRDEDRFGRHYYDVYKLLEHDTTLRKLAKREDFDVIVRQTEEMSARHFGGTTPRPQEGFAVSPAFRPEGDLREWTEANFNRSLELLPQGAARPSFGQVLHRVEEHAELL